MKLGFGVNAGFAFVADQTSRVVYKINTTTGATTTFATTSGATVGLRGLAFDSSGNLYVTNAGSGGSQIYTVGTGGGTLGTFALSGTAVTTPFDITFNVLTTAVTLEAFAATGYDGRVLLEWHTGAEVDNLGFNLYREQGGARPRVNPHLIAGSALLVGGGTTLRAGHAYTWWDASPPDAANARYWLEDIDLNGQSTWHGPVAVVPSTSPAPASSQATLLHSLGRGAGLQSPSGPAERRATLALLPAIPATGQSAPASQAAMNLSVRGAGGSSSTPPALSNGQFPLATQPAVKLGVRQEGWYRVPLADLVAAGLDPWVNPRLLHLYVDGHEVPMLVTGWGSKRFNPYSNAAIEFYGLGLDAAWTDTRVYWLTAGASVGQRIAQVSAQSAPPPDPSVPVLQRGLKAGVRVVPITQPVARSFPYTVERKERTIYFSALLNGERENFFGAVVSATPVTGSLLVPHLDAAPPGNPTLEVTLQGVTLGAHRVQVTLNGASVGEVDFQDRDAKVASFPVAPSRLQEGANQFVLTAVAGVQDISLVDAMRLTYWHTYTADNDTLRFSAAGGQRVTIAGFSSAAMRVVDITEPDAVHELLGVVNQQGGQFAVTLTVPGSDARTLLAFIPAQVQRPATMTAHQPSHWRQPGQGADLVIISHRAFLPSIVPLQALRQRQGLRVTVVDVEDLYDEFSYGEKTPSAVQNFLAYAKAQWQPAPRFVLFAGHASYDPKNYLGFGDSDFVPTKLIDTALMETASDDWFADFNGDGLPEMAVGRLPVRTAQEADRLVAKLLGYEERGGGSEVLLVAGRNDGFDFEGVNEQLRDLLPATVTVEEIDRGQLDADTAKSQLLASLNRGPALVNYAGHGSGNLWGGSLLTADDAHGLRNDDRLSVFVPMTCLNGFAHAPTLESLAEALLSAEGGGVAVWASSGMTGADGQAVMNQELYRLLFTESNLNGMPLTLGEAAARAKAAVSDADIRRTWMLLGDPTMKLKIR